jgi:hypothetical protein
MSSRVRHSHRSAQFRIPPASAVSARRGPPCALDPRFRALRPSEPQVVVLVPKANSRAESEESRKCVRTARPRHAPLAAVQRVSSPRRGLVPVRSIVQQVIPLACSAFLHPATAGATQRANAPHGTSLLYPSFSQWQDDSAPVRRQPAGVYAHAWLPSDMFIPMM